MAMYALHPGSERSDFKKMTLPAMKFIDRIGKRKFTLPEGELRNILPLSNSHIKDKIRQTRPDRGECPNFCV